MAKHHPDLIMCRKQPGICAPPIALHPCALLPPLAEHHSCLHPCLYGAAVGRLCEKCDGKCPICDSYVRPCVLVRICDECNYGSYQGRCVICGAPGISDAYYCKECTQQEKDVSRPSLSTRRVVLLALPASSAGVANLSRPARPSPA